MQDFACKKLHLYAKNRIFWQFNWLDSPALQIQTVI